MAADVKKRALKQGKVHISLWAVEMLCNAAEGLRDGSRRQGVVGAVPSTKTEKHGRSRVSCEIG